MRRILLILIMVSSVLTATGQGFTITDINTLGDQFIFERSRRGTVDYNRYARIDGSPFLNEKFKEGEVIINDSLMVLNVPMRYNMHTDRIEFIGQNGLVLEMNTQGNRFEFNFDDRRFTTANYFIRGVANQGILEMLIDGEVQLYKKRDVEFREAEKARGYQDPKPDRFVARDDILLLSKSHGEPVAILTRRDIEEWVEKNLPGKREVTDIKRIRVGNENSMVGLVEFLNQN